jgi:hypothetical protein
MELDILVTPGERKLASTASLAVTAGDATTLLNEIPKATL